MDAATLSAEIQHFSLGFAVVIDTALLLALLDRGNRQWAVIPYLSLILFTDTFHRKPCGGPANVRRTDYNF